MVKVGGIQSLRPFERVRRAGRFRQADPTSDASFYPIGAERRTAIRPPLHFQRIELKYFLPYRWIEHFVERMSPVEAIPDLWGAVQAVRFERMVSRDGKWKASGELVRFKTTLTETFSRCARSCRYCWQ